MVGVVNSRCVTSINSPSHFFTIFAVRLFHLVRSNAHLTVIQEVLHDFSTRSRAPYIDASRASSETLQLPLGTPCLPITTTFNFTNTSSSTTSTSIGKLTSNFSRTFSSACLLLVTSPLLLSRPWYRTSHLFAPSSSPCGRHKPYETIAQTLDQTITHLLLPTDGMMAQNWPRLLMPMAPSREFKQSYTFAKPLENPNQVSHVGKVSPMY